jgi:hypothetical protein
MQVPFEDLDRLYVLPQQLEWRCDRDNYSASRVVGIAKMMIINLMINEGCFK